ncbi:MAG: dienelactone hydrolase family protein [Proteobacteria bacterium]|nr:dienelactone hydrolase family protein [Pseudomonadota bacterium]MDA1022169.1 dienelactone hydrolase family protein [Pseudomonadota bacterium]
MSGSEILIKASDGGEFMGYLATPDSGSGPGVVVIQEIFGVNDVMRGITDSFAEAGYMALCPDIFWRQVPGIQLSDQTEAEWARAFELFNGFDLDKGVADLDATIEMLRGQDGCTGKVGSVGFCLGGRLAYLTATRTNADACVSYYGVMLTEHLDETVNAPLVLHIPTEDEYVPKDQQAEVHARLDGNDKVTIYDYQGQDHAFARVGGKHFDQASADAARLRTLEHFKAHLG